MMNLLRCSWRASLVATALWAMFGSFPTRAVAAENSDGSQSTRAAANRENLEQELRSIKEKIGQLEKEGKHEEAQKLVREAREIYSKMNNDPERETVRKHYIELHQKLAAAEKEGNRNEAERLRREIQAQQSRLYPNGTNPTGHPQTSEIREKLQHLRVAAENLKAAGCDPEAQHVMQMIEQIQQAARAASHPSTADAARDSANSPVVQELRGQLEQMQREMREMHEQLNRAQSNQLPR